MLERVRVPTPSSGGEPARQPANKGTESESDEWSPVPREQRRLSLSRKASAPTTVGKLAHGNSQRCRYNVRLTSATEKEGPPRPPHTKNVVSWHTPRKPAATARSRRSTRTKSSTTAACRSEAVPATTSHVGYDDVLVARSPEARAARAGYN